MRLLNLAIGLPLLAMCLAGCNEPAGLEQDNGMDFRYQVAPGHSFFLETRTPAGNPFPGNDNGIWIGDRMDAKTVVSGIPCEKDDPNYWLTLTLRNQPDGPMVSSYRWDHIDCYLYYVEVDERGQVTLLRGDETGELKDPRETVGPAYHYP